MLALLLVCVPICKPLSAQQALLDVKAAEPKNSTLVIPPRVEEPAPTTLFNHFKDERLWVSGQFNVIFQSNLPFHAAYSGTNSFLNRGAYKTSLLGTLYLGCELPQVGRLRSEALYSEEYAGGRGLSEALGVAGFTDLDVVRNPNLGNVPYMARYSFHETLALSNEEVDQERGPFALAGKVPVRRIEARIGKFSLPDFFDLNSISSDSHLQFMNWSDDNNGAWDYAADTRGYTTGGMIEYDDRNWSFRYAIAAMPIIANGISLDWAFSRAHGQNFEYELRKSLIAKREGTVRALFYANNAHMGNYREAVQQFLNGSDTRSYGVTVPTITLHEKYGALKYGFGLNAEQEVTSDLRLSGRFGWNEGQHESFAYTEIDQTFEFAGDYRGTSWHRPLDKVGVAGISNAIKRDHQNYLRDGGLGFILGDGGLVYSPGDSWLHYGRENIVETYYNLHAWRGLYYALDIQHIDNPGYNRDRGPIWVGSVRMHLDF
jgi:hypothetical protein